VALFLHDIAKGIEVHRLRRADARRFLSAARVVAGETDTVAWLIEQHSSCLDRQSATSDRKTMRLRRTVHRSSG